MPRKSKKPKSAKNMKEVLEGPLKRFLNPMLMKALGHPLREHVLAVTNERIASGTEVAAELGTDVSTIYYHFEELEEFGCIEEVDVRPSRGGNEHFFRAKASMVFDDAVWAGLPETLKADLTVDRLQALCDEAMAAIRGGTFNVRADSHMSWNPSVLDALGWKEAMALLAKTLAQLLRIQRRSAARILKSGESGIPVTVGLIGFEACPDFGGPSKGGLRSQPEREHGRGQRRASAR